MEAYKLDDEFFRYWSKLNVVQKETLLNVVKNFLPQEEEQFIIPEEDMAKIRKDREDYLNGIGKTYTREEARKIVLSNQKQHGL